MDKINDAVSWYQHKIGTYDKQLWERSVEKKVIKSIHSIPKKTVKNKPELIDVDLVRGSTFPKAKPRHGWLSVTRRGLLRVILFPFYFRWWRQQINLMCTLVLFALYCMQLVTLIIYWQNLDGRLSPEVISVCHVLIPLVMALLLGVIHAHIVATQESYRPHRKAEVRNKSADRPKCRKMKNKSASSTSGQSEHESRLHNMGASLCTENASCLRQRKFSCKMSVPRRRSGSTLANGTLLSGSKIMDKSDEADDETDDDVRYSKVKGAEKRVMHQKATDEADNQKIAGTKCRELKIDTLSKPREASGMSELADLGIKQENDLLQRFAKDAVSDLGEDRSDVDRRFTDEISPCSFEDRELFEGFAEVTGQVVDVTNARGEDGHYASLFGDVECPDDVDLVREMDKDSGITMRNDTDSGVTMRNDTDSNSEASHILEAAPYQVMGGVASSWGSIVCDANGSLPSCDDRAAGHSADNAAGGCGAMATDLNDLGSRSVMGNRRKPSSLNLRCSQLKQECVGISSCDSEGDATTPQTPKLLSSEMEWVDNSEMTSCGDTSSNTASDSELSDDTLTENHSDKENNAVPHVASVINNLASGSDKVSCMIWEGEEVKKIDLTVLDIGWTIIRKVDKIPETCDYLVLGLVFTILVSAMPCAFRIYQSMDKLEPVEPLAITPEHLQKAKKLVFGQFWSETGLVINGMIQRCFMGFIFFFLLSVAERTFKQRLLYAKHFCYLTSSRRAKKYDMPHFRLNKVRNIKTWFSLRSYLKKRGPQRSVDTIVSAAFILEVILVSVMCFQLLQGSETFLEHLGNWELVIWCMALAIYLLRFMTLGTKINKKYRNFSVLITEQINLYLQMEQKPHKKDELMMANSVLKLAEALLKELEIPFKISGLSANPFLYNITKVILLSAFSAVLTELFGFKLKLYKIKLRA